MAKSAKQKVLFIHPDLGIGGAERLVLDVAVALSKNEKDVMFVTNHYDKNHAFQELKDNTFQVRVIGNWIPRSVCGICQALCSYIRMLFLSLVYVLFVRKIEKPDIYFVDQIPMAVPFIKWSGGKIIYYCHHPDLLASPPGGFLKMLYRLPINWLESKGTEMADVILVNSKYTRSVFSQTFPHIRKEIKVVYPTISSLYQNTIANTKVGKIITQIVPEIYLPDDGIIFLSINRYHPAKNLELAINAFEALQTKLSPDEWNRVHFIMAGGYDPRSKVNAKYFSKLIDLCYSKELMSKVTFLKSPSDSLKTDLLLTCTCLLYTPVNEHFGIVPLEAMTAGKPVIACNSGGPCETIDPNVTGYLCDPTSESMANAMVKIFNKDDTKQMGIKGKERLDKYFSYGKFANSVNEIVAETILKGEQKCKEITTDKQQTDLGRRFSNVSQLDSVVEESEADEANSSGTIN